MSEKWNTKELVLKHKDFDNIIISWDDIGIQFDFSECRVEHIKSERSYDRNLINITDNEAKEIKKFLEYVIPTKKESKNE